MLSILGSLLTWLLGLFGSSTRKDEISLGRAEQQLADHKEDMTVILRANKAAQTAAEQKVEQDDNNLDKGV